MDKIDKKIIFELQKNGRLSNFQIADKVGLSPSPCLRRIKNLEKKRRRPGAGKGTQAAEQLE